MDLPENTPLPTFDSLVDQMKRENPSINDPWFSLDLVYLVEWWLIRLKPEHEMKLEEIIFEDSEAPLTVLSCGGGQLHRRACNGTPIWYFNGGPFIWDKRMIMSLEARFRNITGIKEEPLPAVDQETVKKMVLRHYGAVEYRPEKVGEIVNYQHDKPKGGLWTSPKDSKRGWIEACYIYEMGSIYDSPSFLLSFRLGARVYQIDTVADLERLPYFKCSKAHRPTPNWEQITEQFDAVWLTLSGYEQSAYTSPFCLAGWDCETVLILNRDCVFQTPEKWKKKK